MQQGSGFAREDTGSDFDLMIELRVREDLKAGAKGAALRVVGAVNDSGNTRLDDRAGTHSAGFDGDVKGRAGEAVVMDELRHFADHHDFGVGGRVVVANGAIAGASQDGSRLDHNGTDRNFTGFGRRFGFGERELHVVSVVRHVPR